MNIDRVELERRMSEFTSVLKSNGIKLTFQRQELFREIASSVEHPDAETIFRTVRKRVPTISRDTVYRTLWLFYELSLVTTLGNRGENIRFDANMKPHHHFVCVRCGLTRDFESREMEALQIPEQARKFGRILGSRVEVRGICADCVNDMGKG